MKDKKKKEIMIKGVSLHLITYILIAILLLALGVESIIVFMVLMVLLWGLVVITYAFYYHK